MEFKNDKERLDFERTRAKVISANLAVLSDEIANIAIHGKTVHEIQTVINKCLERCHDD